MRARALTHATVDCSGLLGRTPLRRGQLFEPIQRGIELFRPSRPDSIETWIDVVTAFYVPTNCSGLLGRTPLRHTLLCPHESDLSDCSGLLGRTPLRRTIRIHSVNFGNILFRPSRPDSIETSGRACRRRGQRRLIVPAF